MAVDQETPRPPGLARRAFVIPAAVLVVLAGLIATVAFRRSPRIKSTPREHWLAVYRGRSFLDRNRPDLALRAVGGVRDEGPGAAEAMCIAGLALAQMEQFRGAKQALERSLKLQPRQPMAYKVLASLYLSMGESGRGLDCLRKSAELQPEDFRPWFTMGKVQLDLGEVEQAAAAFREATRRDGKDVDSRLGLIEALLGLGRAEEARGVVAETMALDPKRARLLGLAARQARDSGRDEEALALADRSLAVDPDDTEALFVRAHILHASGQSEKALVDVERLVTINPNQLAGLNLLAQVESRLGLDERAAQTSARRKKAGERLALMDALTKEIARRPDDPEPRWRLGLAAVEGNQRTLATNCFQAALAVKPDYAPAREGLAALQSSGSPQGPSPNAR